MSGLAPIRRLARLMRRRVLMALAATWRPYSRLLLVSDAPHWSVAWDMRELAGIAQRLGVRLAPAACVDILRGQCAFFGSQFDMFNRDSWFEGSNRLATAYFHGRPGSGIAEFDEGYRRLGRLHPRMARIQVSHSEMRDVVLSSGIDPAKVFLIPIGINPAFFRPQTPAARRRARAHLGLPQNAVVVGSFQKDGVGWADGRDPKLIKGPDVFVDAMRILKSSVPDLFVLLSGPARGYVKAGLTALGIPYVHRVFKHYPDLGEMYQALDVYVVSSRQEGGPKSVLESMASGVPLVTTRVGQAMDIVEHGVNGWMVPVEDAAGLAQWAAHAVASTQDAASVREAACQTAAKHTYQAQAPLWKAFMTGFVETEA